MSASSQSLLRIFIAMLRLGAVSFGGLGATLALLQREFVDKRRWLEAPDLKDALAFTKPLPGSTVVQVMTFLGWRLAGWPGALVATIAFLLPAIALMTVAAAATFALHDVRWVHGALTGVQVAIVGLLASAFWRLARSEADAPLLTGVLALSFAAGLFVNAALVIAWAGIIGVLLDRGGLRV